MKATHAKWELRQKPFQQGNQVVFIDVFDTTDDLPLRHFVDHVDGVGSLFPFLFGRVHGVDAQVSGTPARLGLAAFADRDGCRSSLVEMQTVLPIDGSFVQVVEVSHRQFGVHPKTETDESGTIFSEWKRSPR